MSSRYIRGDTRPAFAPVLTAQAVAVGDLACLSAGNVIRSTDVSWGSAVATPTTPTAANSSTAVGSELTNGSTGVKISYQFPWGEGALSSAALATPTAAACIKLSGSSVTPPAPALHTNIYVETSAAGGSGTFLYWGRTYGPDVFINSYGNGQAPYAGNPGGVAVASDATALTQYAFAKTMLGVAASRKDAGSARCYGYSSDNLIRIDTSGVWEFDCASATFNVGDFVGSAKDTGNDLLTQSVVAVAASPLAVGRVVEAGTSVVKVKVEILSGLDPSARAS